MRSFRVTNPTSVALHQNHLSNYLSKCLNKCQSFILNLKMPNIKSDCEEEPTINNFYKILNMIFKVRIDRSQLQYFISTEVDRNTPWRQVSSGTRMVHQQRHMPSGETLERDFQISKHHLKSQRETSFI